jgi:hypothetical protein
MDLLQKEAFLSPNVSQIELGSSVDGLTVHGCFMRPKPQDQADFR